MLLLFDKYTSVKPQTISQLFFNQIYALKKGLWIIQERFIKKNIKEMDFGTLKYCGDVQGGSNRWVL